MNVFDHLLGIKSAMKIEYWVSFALACVGLLPTDALPLLGHVGKHSSKESLIFGSLLIGLLSAGWFFLTHRKSA